MNMMKKKTTTTTTATLGMVRSNFALLTLAMLVVAGVVREASSLSVTLWNPPLMPVQVSPRGEVVIMGELKLNASTASAPAVVVDVTVSADDGDGGGGGVFFTIENEIAPLNEAGPGNRVVFAGEALQGNLRFFHGSTNAQKVEPTLDTDDDWAVFFFVLHIDPHGTVAGSVPESLRFEVRLSDNQTATITESVVDQSQAVVAQPPLRGGPWIATNSIQNTLSTHRRAISPAQDNRIMIQRYAIDWVKYDPSNLKPFSGDGSNNDDWACWGEPLYATHDGTVAAVLNTLPDNIPFKPPLITINESTVLGNHVLIDIGGGRFSVYAHMQEGSVRVNVGESVKAGQVVGLLGNSGNSGAPHLHHHIGRCLEFTTCADWPYVLSSYTLLTTLARHPLDLPSVAWMGAASVTLPVVDGHPFNGDVVQFASESPSSASAISSALAASLGYLYVLLL